MRLLLVKLGTREQKWQLLKNAKKLNKCEHKLKTCFIAPDRTKSERDLDLKL